MASIRRLSLAAWGYLAFIPAAPALAAADADAVVARTCVIRQGVVPPVDDDLRRKLAEAVVGQAGVLGSELMADPDLPAGATYGERAVRAIHKGSVNGFDDAMSVIPRLRQRLEQMLGPRSNVSEDDLKLRVINPPSGQNWLFDPTNRALRLRCIDPKPPRSIINVFEEGTRREALSVREKVDELGLTGDPAKNAGAAKIALSRTRTERDDGSRKTVASLAVNGTLGLRLTEPNAVSPLYLYAVYALSHERTDPDPDPTKDQSDGDVDALETGLSINSMIIRRASDWSLVGGFQAAYVKDFADDAKRLKLRVALTPGIVGDVGPLCDVGGYSEKTAFGLRFRTRCLVKIEGEASHVLEPGTADFQKHGRFLSLGATGTYQVAAPMGDKAEMLASIAYRYLPVIAGDAPDISRWNASIKYRFWLDGGPGFDLGLTWAKGQEPISYKEEDRLELGFGGIIF